MDKFILIAGPCVLESEDFGLHVAKELKRQLGSLESQIDFYFKASFDKANRTSGESFRGPGLTEGLKSLARIKSETQFKLLTDFHLPNQADEVAEVVDVIQVPAFLSRQTDMIEAGSYASKRYGRKLNVKKGQFLAPWDAKNIVEKVDATGLDASQSLWITERGSCFGYNSLVVDMISFQAIQKFGVKVIYDATHSIQTPVMASGVKTTGGKREYLEVLARAAVAAGCNGLFMECHPKPEIAKSDGPNAFYLDKVGAFVKQLLEIRQVVGNHPKLLPEALC
jgi:2-dehydro-3-deoxyphosphooctonate aldolase (KDO 8-P synthase)